MNHCCFGLLVAALSCGAGTAWAGDLTRFELDDGSVVLGEALGLADGIYRIRTPALGEIDVEASRIRSMSRATGQGASGDAGDAGEAAYSADIEAIQRQIVGDGDMMQSIIALQNDPELQNALQDPDLVRLIMSGNVEALRDHEGMQRLMEHPGIRGILDQFVGPDGQLR